MPVNRTRQARKPVKTDLPEYQLNWLLYGQKPAQDSGYALRFMMWQKGLKMYSFINETVDEAWESLKKSHKRWPFDTPKPLKNESHGAYLNRTQKTVRVA